jgi:hypothetical protein
MRPWFDPERPDLQLDEKTLSPTPPTAGKRIGQMKQTKRQSRTLLPDNYRLGRAKEDTYSAHAKEARQKEQESQWSEARDLWIKAKHRATNQKDYDWAYDRALFCKTRSERQQPYPINEEVAA